jgi:hypothetical protein
VGNFDSLVLYSFVAKIMHSMKSVVEDSFVYMLFIWLILDIFHILFRFSLFLSFSPSHIDFLSFYTLPASIASSYKLCSNARLLYETQ